MYLLMVCIQAYALNYKIVKVLPKGCLIYSNIKHLDLWEDKPNRLHRRLYEIIYINPADYFPD